ncbi:MAG: hypothetical protein WA987_10745 [Cellvibrio sp.]
MNSNHVVEISTDLQRFMMCAFLQPIRVAGLFPRTLSVLQKERNEQVFMELFMR